jgi:hypothetical protein
MILLKWIKILLKYVNVWGRLEKITESPGQRTSPLLDLTMFVANLKGEESAKATSCPFKVGFLNVRKSVCLTPLGSRSSSFPDRVSLHP